MFISSVGILLLLEIKGLVDMLLMHGFSKCQTSYLLVNTAECEGGLRESSLYCQQLCCSLSLQQDDENKMTSKKGTFTGIRNLNKRDQWKCWKVTDP